MYKFLLIALLLTACGGDPTRLPPVPSISTPKGATVYVIEGENPTTADLAEIDKQIDRITEIANGLNRGYKWPAHSRHVIELVSRDNGEGECETPGAFKTEANQYGGDKICVAGRYYPETDRIKTTLVALRTMKIVQYESEHFGIKLNDQLLYQQTLTHNAENLHPILGEE